MCFPGVWTTLWGCFEDIQQRDDNLYRVILQADPVSPAISSGCYGGTNRYEELMDLANAKLGGEHDSKIGRAFQKAL